MLFGEKPEIEELVAEILAPELAYIAPGLVRPGD